MPWLLRLANSYSGHKRPLARLPREGWLQFVWCASLPANFLRGSPPALFPCCCRELFPQLVRVLRELAAFVNCRPQDLALLPNATTGLNTVLSSFRGRLGPGDAVRGQL